MINMRRFHSVGKGLLRWWTSQTVERHVSVKTHYTEPPSWCNRPHPLKDKGMSFNITVLVPMPISAWMLIYLKNKTRDIFVVHFTQLVSCRSYSWVFYSVNGIHPFMIIELLIVPFQSGRTVGATNIFNVAFTLSGMIPSKSPQSQKEEKREQSQSDLTCLFHIYLLQPSNRTHTNFHYDLFLLLSVSHDISAA